MLPFSGISSNKKQVPRCPIDVYTVFDIHHKIIFDIIILISLYIVKTCSLAHHERHED